MGYKILDYDIDMVSEYGLCYKNKLPEELKKRLYTQKQWLERGYVLKDNVTGYLMHSQKGYKNKVVYYLDMDVKPICVYNVPKTCLTCLYRGKKGYCEIAGDFVGEINSCSEWENKYAE